MRTILRSREFDAFYTSLPARVMEKVKYALNIMAEIAVVNTKLVKKLVGTEFYELRISMENEWRVIMYTVDKESFIECRTVLMLNGFMKKSTKDYKKEVDRAQKILGGFRI